MRLNALHEIEKSTSNTDEGANTDRLEAMKETLSFKNEVQDFKKQIDSLPDDWIVIQLSVIGPKNGQLMVTRIQKKKPPFILHLPGYTSKEGMKTKNAFDTLFLHMKSTLVMDCKNEWWENRKNLEQSLINLSEKIQFKWLQGWIGCLLPLTKKLNKAQKQAIEALAERLKIKLEDHRKIEMLTILLQTIHLLYDMEAAACLSELSACQKVTVSLLRKIASEIHIKYVENDSSHVNLILDNIFQHIPWESFKSLKNQSITRQPSFIFLLSQIQYHGFY